MYKIYKLIGITAILFFASHAGMTAFAMGGSSDADSIPLPSKNFSVDIKDAKSVQTSASYVTWNGKIFIDARRGSTEVTVPFEKIKSVELSPDKPDKDNFLPATIILQDGSEIKVYLDSRSKFYGETSFGNFKIYARDLMQIDFK